MDEDVFNVDIIETCSKHCQCYHRLINLIAAVDLQIREIGLTINHQMQEGQNRR